MNFLPKVLNLPGSRPRVKKNKMLLLDAYIDTRIATLKVVHEVMKERLQDLNNSSKQVIILGDTSIKFLQYCNDNRTADYLDMLLDSSFMPIITKVTRKTDHSKISIDHIYTNVLQKVLKSSIYLAGISDHLPVFYAIAHKFSNESRIHFSRLISC